MHRRDFLKLVAVTPSVHLVGADGSGQSSQPRTAPGQIADGWVKQRPRLYFDKQAVARLREQVKGDDRVKQRWSKLLERAEALVKAELVPETAAKQEARTGSPARANYPLPSGQISRMGMTLGLAYHVTGEERYARKLRQALLHYIGYERWCAPAYITRKPSWNSELATAAFCFGYAAGYDALYDVLPAGERKQIAEAMVRLGVLPTLNDWVLPQQRIHALDSMGHNWWSVCVAMAGVAALALLGDDERAPAWVEQVARGLELWFGYRGNVLQNKPANFDAAGAFYESVGYANYALSEYLLFRLALANVAPKYPQPPIPVLEKAGDFFVHTFYPTSASFLAVDFGDSSLRTSAAKTVRLLLANGLGNDAARWYMKRTDPNSSDALALLRPTKAGPDLPPLPTSVIYPDPGWAMLRSSWKDDATLLAVKSGHTWNHAHADAGSFILFHAGMPLIIDSGTCSYGRREYKDYYCQSRAHNVVLFNGQGQPAEDFARASKFNGRVHSLMDGLGVKYVYADATGPMARYLSRNYRHWLWLEGAILVFDDLLAHEAGRFDWLLHYAGSARHKAGEVTLSNGPAQAIVRFLFPEKLDVREEQGLVDNEPDRKRTYLSFSPKAGAREQKFITAILPTVEGQAGALPELELLSGPEVIGVRLRRQERITDVYLNLQADGRRMHLNSNNAIDGWETDAYLLALIRPAAAKASTPATVSRYFVSAGSYLRKGGQVVLDSLAKATALFQVGEQMEVWLQGQEVIEAALHCPTKPARVVVNGQETKFSYESSEKLARFRCRGL